jgi:hypothetical protein
LKKTGNGKTVRIDYQFFDLTIAISPALSNLKVHLSSRQLCIRRCARFFFGFPRNGFIIFQ